MMYAVTSLCAVGCTFLDWSIHFLSNQNYFYNVDQGLVPLSANPLLKNNAHGHKRNHPVTLERTKEVIDNLKINSNLTSLKSMYPAVAGWNNLDPMPWNEAEIIMIDNLNKMFLLCRAEGFKTILVGVPSNMYLNTERNSNKTFFKKEYDQKEEVDELRLDYFFNFQNKKSDWNGLDKVWDKREFLALNSRPLSYPFENCDLYDEVMHNVDFYIDPNDLWFNGEVILKQVLNLLSLKPDEARLAKWLPIYHEWQKIHIKSLRLSWNLDHIISCIVKGSYFDLSSFNLNLMDEATILHVLIYKHNLNIKGYGVDKFIDTKQLHELLEENIHDIKSV